MDFELGEDHTEIRRLTERIFADQAGPERVRRVEAEEGGFDRRLWTTLADAGVLGVAVPEEAGGAGMGMLGLLTLLEQQGRRVAPVPLWATLATAALPLARFGSPEQIWKWLPGLLAGSAVVTGTFDAPGGQDAVLTAEPGGAGWTMSGELVSVPAAAVADALLLPARTESGEVVVALVPTGRDGVCRTPLEVTNHESQAAVTLDGVAVAATEVLPGNGSAIVRWTRRRARVALAAVQLGVCAQALRSTASYTSEREQFGRPLSTNQAVAVRAADAYVDTECIRVTTQRAAWLLDTGREDEAESAALVAKWWASRGGLRVVQATQHLHGGIGADVDYPIHRYFLWGRQLAFSLGGAAAVAAELGERLDHAPAIGAPG